MKIGSYIKFLMDSRSKTVKEVAEYLEIDQERLVKIIENEIPPQNGYIIGLSGFLGVPFNALNRPSNEPQQATHYHYRRTTDIDLSGGYEYELNAYFDYVLELAKLIDDQQDRKTIKIYNTREWGKSDILEKATELRQILGIQKNGAITPNLIVFLENTVNLLFTYLPETMNGVILFRELKDSLTNFIIFINKNEKNINKQCFTVAHEFAHLMLHNGNGKREKDDTKSEDEAHMFANFFLLPQEDIKSFFDTKDISTLTHTSPDLRELSDKYCVSYKTIYYSLYHAELIQEPQLRKLCKEYDNNRDKISVIPAKQTNDAYLKLIDKAVKSKKISIDYAMAMSGYTYVQN